MKLENFKNRIPIIIRYDDLDTYGHVNNKVFLSYLEEARILYMREVMGFAPKNLDFEAVVGRVDIRYTAPLFLYDETYVYTRCSRIGKKSYELESYIVKKISDKEIISAKANVTMVSYDLKQGISKENGISMINKILDYEIVEPLRE